LTEFEFALPPITKQLPIVKACEAALEVGVTYEAAFNAALVYQASIREQTFAIPTTPKRLGELIQEIQAGKSLVGIEEPPSADEFAVLKVSAVGKRSFLPKESKKLINQADFADIHSVRAGDILITRANTPDLVGLACLVTEAYENLMLSDKTLRLVPASGVPNRLLLEALRTQAARQYLKANATGTGGAMKNISQAKLREMPIKFPSEKRWRQDATQLEIAEATAILLEARHMNAKKIIKSVIHDFLGGP
jgi:type I restriction enzyme S subunit